LFQAGRRQYILRQLLLGGLIWRGEDGHAVRKGCFRLFSYTLLIDWVGDTSFDVDTVRRIMQFQLIKHVPS
jgi:hypothetical protein